MKFLSKIERQRLLDSIIKRNLSKDLCMQFYPYVKEHNDMVEEIKRLSEELRKFKVVDMFDDKNKPVERAVWGIKVEKPNYSRDAHIKTLTPGTTDWELKRKYSGLTEEEMLEIKNAST